MSARSESASADSDRAKVPEGGRLASAVFAPTQPQTAMRVAALADVHGNAPALEAVLADVDLAEPDVVVLCGDLTWGSFPKETLALNPRSREEAVEHAERLVFSG